MMSRGEEEEQNVSGACKFMTICDNINKNGRE